MSSSEESKQGHKGGVRVRSGLLPGEKTLFDSIAESLGPHGRKIIYSSVASVAAGASIGSFALMHRGSDKQNLADAPSSVASTPTAGTPAKRRVRGVVTPASMHVISDAGMAFPRDSIKEYLFFENLSEPTVRFDIGLGMNPGYKATLVFHEDMARYYMLSAAETADKKAIQLTFTPRVKEDGRQPITLLLYGQINPLLSVPTPNPNSSTAELPKEVVAKLSGITAVSILRDDGTTVPQTSAASLLSKSETWNQVAGSVNSFGHGLPPKPEESLPLVIKRKHDELSRALDNALSGTGNSGQITAIETELYGDRHDPDSDGGLSGKEDERKSRILLLHAKQARTIER